MSPQTRSVVETALLLLPKLMCLFFIFLSGGAIGAPAWGKFWLAVLNCYSYEGMNPVPPELWILPYMIPLHAGRYWCHTRMVYLPMGWFYANRWSAELTDLIRSLREVGFSVAGISFGHAQLSFFIILHQELYVEPYDKIDWSKAPNNICAADLYTPHTKLMDLANGGSRSILCRSNC